MDRDLLNNWATQLRKGILEYCILNAIRETHGYGYDIVKKLKQIEGLVIGEGTIYPILSRFKRDGLVQTFLEESQEGPARKYYRLTDRGKWLLSEMSAHWQIIKVGVESLEKGEPL